VIYDPTATQTLSVDTHHMKRGTYSAYEGMSITGRVRTVLVPGPRLSSTTASTTALPATGGSCPAPLSQYLNWKGGPSWTSASSLQTDPPAKAVRGDHARGRGAWVFRYGWTFDSHVPVGRKPFVIYSQILAATESMMVGPMVDQPGPPGTGR